MVQLDSMSDTKKNNDLALEVLSVFLKKECDKQTLPFSFLRAMVDLSKRGNASSYPVHEIQDQLTKQYGLTKGMSKPKREIDGAERLLKKNEYQLALIAREQGHNYVPSIARARKSNDKAFYYSVSGVKVDVNELIETNNQDQAINRQESSEQSLRNSDEIIYSFDTLDPKRLHLLLKLDVNKHWLFGLIYSNVAQILLSLGLFSFIFMLSLIPMFNGLPPYLLNISIFLILLGIILWAPLHSYHLAWWNNVSSAPDHLIKKNVSAILLYKLNAPGSERGLRQKLQLINVHALCPICKQRIEVEKKRNRLLLSLFSSSDLVGRCRGNPRLHKFTFDLTKTSGKLIQKC